MALIDLGYSSDVDIQAEFTRLLGDIEGEMRSVLAERDGHARPLYDQLAYHLGLDQTDGARGKRIRPLLGLLAYRSIAGEHKGALPGAAAVELGHNFSLVHDDIEDGDLERRHRPTLWAIWGIPLAINAGDALFALSRLALYRLLDGGFSERRVLEIMRIYDETCLALCEGQYLDISFERSTDVTVETYMDMIGKKTAALIGASVQAGALLATDDPDIIGAYRRFGFDLGLAFQIADDVKGSFWSSDRSGKAEAGDVRHRKKTLPVVWAFEHASAAESARLRELFGPNDQPMTDDQVEEALGILIATGARDHAQAEARRLRDGALAELDALPIDDLHRVQLRALVESIIAP